MERDDFGFLNDLNIPYEDKMRRVGEMVEETLGTFEEFVATGKLIEPEAEKLGLRRAQGLQNKFWEPVDVPEGVIQDRIYVAMVNEQDQRVDFIEYLRTDSLFNRGNEGDVSGSPGSV